MITVFLQSIFPTVINELRRNLLTSMDIESALRGFQNTTRYLAGLAANSAIVAFFISMMVGIAISRVLLRKRTGFNITITLLGMVSLFLTQKRSFALGTILAIIIVVLFFKKGIAKKFYFIMTLLIVGSIGLYIMYRVSPAMTIFMNRLLHNSDILSGRDNMYEIMAEWFRKSPIIGVGIGTANHSFGYGGHNCYRQLLGEEGILGCIIYLLMIGPYLLNLFKDLVESWNSREQNEYAEYYLAASICLTIILIYALVGNPFYDFTFCLTMFMLLAIPTQIKTM
ncbi:MAG: O-antigen ligase family protein [Oscillospiraceae bacterium]|nr:O-antigen ligase family protein [Oscillospiraceae bacterium]